MIPRPPPEERPRDDDQPDDRPGVVEPLDEAEGDARIDGTTSAAPVAIVVAVTSHPSGPRTSGLPVQSRCDAATAIDANAVPASSMWMRPVRVSEDIPSG